MIFGDFKHWVGFYRDMMRGDYSPAEQDWVGKYLLWALLDARRIVSDCRNRDEPLPPFEVRSGKAKP